MELLLVQVFSCKHPLTCYSQGSYFWDMNILLKYMKWIIFELQIKIWKWTWSLQVNEQPKWLKGTWKNSGWESNPCSFSHFVGQLAVSSLYHMWNVPDLLLFSHQSCWATMPLSMYDISGSMFKSSIIYTIWCPEIIAKIFQIWTMLTAVQVQVHLFILIQLQSCALKAW